MNLNRTKLKGNLLLILTAMIWGTAFAFQRTGMETIEPVTFNAARMFLAAAAVGGVSAAMGRGREKDPVRTKNTVEGGICCGLCLTAASLLQQVGIVYTTAGKAGFITAMYMIMVPVIGFLFLKKKTSGLVWIAVVMGMAGMYLLCMNTSLQLNRGDILVFLCAVVFSLHILSCDHFAPIGDPVAISAIQFLVTGILSAGIALLTEAPATEKLLSAAVPILYCGLVSGGVGYTLQIVAQRYTEPATASLLMSLESVFAVIAGTLLLKERMSIRELTGCIIMFAAIIVVQIPLFMKNDAAVQQTGRQDQTDFEQNR